ncbi:hypothetical protein EUX98_g3983 [Antrodiella citrinella]|uniref:Uncharacterized protein n=1 Tax=Antrodiella citrinella TaxID=2447956 RepID=A0A4S4MXN8_9APHY|nr:hypothetical protein EUX98_g3983 [Antrodiella citrinella]
MVQATPQNYKQAYEQRLEKYSESAGASALFYFSDANSKEEQGLRIEAPEIMKEFVDKVPYGRDPVGTLFYNSIDDILGKTKYNVIYSDSSVPDADACVIVQFFGSTQDKFYAEFVGKDPARTVWWIVDGTQHSGGSWNPLSLVTSTAYVYKRSTESNVTISLNPIGKQVSFDVPSGFDTGKSVSVWGNLSTNNISKLAKGTKSVVNYNNDRIVLYPENGNTNMTAVFIPLETRASDVRALGDMRFTSSDQIALWDELQD